MIEDKIWDAMYQYELHVDPGQYPRVIILHPTLWEQFVHEDGREISDMFFGDIDVLTSNDIKQDEIKVY